MCNYLEKKISTAMNQHNQEHDVQNVVYAVITLHFQLPDKFGVNMDQVVTDFSVTFTRGV